jgi:hypothetical protein
MVARRAVPEMADHTSSSGDGADQRGFLHFDFKVLFPYKFWISSWGKDQSYPNGFRYKILTGIDRRAGTARIVILLEEADECKTPVADLVYERHDIDHVATSMVEHLETQFHVMFEAYDFSGANSFEDYVRLSQENGWTGPTQL